MMLSQMLPAIRANLLLALITGIIFPLVITAVGQIIAPNLAHGSLIRNADLADLKNSSILGSSLIGQQFSQPKYFHPRPSAAGSGYSGEASSATNLGPTSAKLIDGQADDPKTANVDESFAGVSQLAKQYRTENSLADSEKIPVDAVTRSCSGLDPHISEANAKLQIQRVAKARNMSIQQITELVGKFSEDRQYGIFGEPRVNVLLLNLGLDKLSK